MRLMTRVLTMLALVCAANAQNLLPVEPGKAFFAQTGVLPLQCEVRPLRPDLDFSFRFHTGYDVMLPLRQYRGPDHHWTVMLRVQPDTVAAPVYLEDRLDLPNVPDTDSYGQYSGSFLAGEGFYQISFLLVDDQQRGCRSEWQIRVRRGFTDRGLRLSMAPGTILATSAPTLAAGRTQIAAPVGRLTVLLDAASGSPTGPIISTMQLGWLPPLLELARARSIRLVAFNMDLHRVIYREEHFTLDHLSNLRQAMFDTQIGVVDVETLRNPMGHIALLADLVKQELHSPEPSSAVVFLGAIAWQKDKPSPNAVETPAAGAPLFCYLQYRRPIPITTILEAQRSVARGLPDASESIPHPTRVPTGDVAPRGPTDVRSGPPPDTIEHLMALLHGRTLVVHTPAEFAKAMQQIAPSKH